MLVDIPDELVARCKQRRADHPSDSRSLLNSLCIAVAKGDTGLKPYRPSLVTPFGLVAIFILVILFCLTACTGEAPVQQVQWDYKERCSVLFNKECGCVETPTEEWQKNFKC